jgi:hypothetical protein
MLITVGKEHSLHIFVQLYNYAFCVNSVKFSHPLPYSFKLQLVFYERLQFTRMTHLISSTPDDDVGLAA